MLRCFLLSGAALGLLALHRFLTEGKGLKHNALDIPHGGIFLGKVGAQLVIGECDL